MFLKKVTLLRENIASYEHYPFSIPSIKTLHELDFRSNVLFFVGENGSGKSTLLEAIADKCEFNTAGGGRNNHYEVHASESALGEYIRLSWLPKITNGFFLRAESFYHFASHIDQVDTKGFKDYGGRSLHKQSHGESFLSLFLHRFKGKAIYLLDEPEAALSPAKQLAFLKVLHDLVSKGDSQFIIATHSPILLGYPNATILSFDNGCIEEIQYEATDHYQITKYFLQHREKFLADLLMNE
ncbi:AAA family ATPase [Aneurinibacillus aneurinilyticus]|jgi:predicted ATPase|uniref:ABC transporter, ATP-binding family protein n=1 Tax=Aneurinibacillus aneurinilyticus ATCC 12856 TaxID=649747 RepID=U1X9K6_ANEAE|nr:AAA family ATPase [Aneurinibacillus aneurinilyticus]ERI11650.1 ABC transporter, ATP-binding family protein [Aneurinibacillus aneurinilyticus ATCC 12856]MCI1692862.1 AAA family ATPase [Aneurinibacillus aneurinilyticus]MED0669685.1 AAA family ATPase [Aneurinibacillus aneurinilyticus]MED0709185.1 AAA family ATPase [Aneurinibacillus aneurinilyticus]MED0724668.1 AAA family ATPase [Aneurinibacillus aneurinilyticus]